MQVAITGATGNLGTSLLGSLSREAQVRQIVGLARRLPSSAFSKTRFVAADISRDALCQHFEGADAVIHLAWQIKSAHDARKLDRINIEGSRRVFAAAAEAKVKTLVYASSVGAYSPSNKSEPRAESWPTEGVPGCTYSRQKAAVERALDTFELEYPAIRVIRMRPALLFKRTAAAHIKDLFVGRLAPNFVFQPKYLRYMIDHPDFRFQALHTEDAAEAFRLALLSEARGAFNIAADPVLDSELLANTLGARKVRIEPKTLHLAVALGFRLRLIPLEPGWVDLSFRSPLLDVSRAKLHLGWAPARSASDALLELLDGLRAGTQFDTPPLRAEP